MLCLCCPGFRWEAWSGQPRAHGRSVFGAALACFELIPAAVLLRFCESAAGFREVFLKLAALGMVVRSLHMGSRTRFLKASVSVDTLDNPPASAPPAALVQTLRRYGYTESLPGLLTRATLRAI